MRAHVPPDPRRRVALRCPFAAAAIQRMDRHVRRAGLVAAGAARDDVTARRFATPSRLILRIVSQRRRWGSGLRQRLRLAPLYLALQTADRLRGLLPELASRALPDHRPGLSVIIPERDSPELLAQALASLEG